jgi:hypothetical protein
VRIPLHKHANSIMIRYVEDIYADFLYDCYIANQRLTEEEWLYYGREEHHIEIPNRDGGTLGPLNSQYLTTYQHWVAGVLQSEVVGKKCFFAIPTGTLPPMMEALRVKWTANHNSITGKTGGARSGRINADSGRLKKQASAAGTKGAKVMNSLRFMCMVTGKIMNPGNLTSYQKRNGIDPSNRVRLPLD